MERIELVQLHWPTETVEPIAVFYVTPKPDDSARAISLIGGSGANLSPNGSGLRQPMLLPEFLVGNQPAAFSIVVALTNILDEVPV